MSELIGCMCRCFWVSNSDEDKSYVDSSRCPIHQYPKPAPPAPVQQELANSLACEWHKRLPADTPFEERLENATFLRLATVAIKYLASAAAELPRPEPLPQLKDLVGLLHMPEDSVTTVRKMRDAESKLVQQILDSGDLLEAIDYLGEFLQETHHSRYVANMMGKDGERCEADAMKEDITTAPALEPEEWLRKLSKEIAEKVRAYWGGNFEPVNEAMRFAGINIEQMRGINPVTLIIQQHLLRAYRLAAQSGEVR